MSEEASGRPVSSVFHWKDFFLCFSFIIIIYFIFDLSYFFYLFLSSTGRIATRRGHFQSRCSVLIYMCISLAIYIYIYTYI